MSAPYRRDNGPVFECDLTLAGHTLPCFPCYPDKTPATPHGFKDAVGSPSEAKELWRRYPAPLIGVPTGEVSGIDVLDIDRRHGGGDWLAEHKHCLPPTRVHRTRGGGLHLLFQHAIGLRCSAGKIASGVDVRATAGYIIWWPAAGLPVVSEAAIALWPEWLRMKLLPPPARQEPRATVPDWHLLMKFVRLIAGAREGERNNITYWVACRAGEMVASGLMDASLAAAVVAEAAMRAGLTRAEAVRTAWNGIHAAAGGPACA